ncbi:phage baseplate assembly protein V [Asticcacaulis sp. BYS171W]|uniref:Phage baseplate assembly protein V n=1 Tax=Asticcacaulis aquaticus TaxID=2984212 RepID=A0ABT5HUZ3_9CAUL|nr:phage baseplate assembly protein V [Asticcacaulis aquaticus]MDC7683271.1 phage baseplate assembly protein V [Asticcacaulis aquaticus]
MDDELQRTIGNLIRLGHVKSVEGARAVVTTGEEDTPPLLWLSLAGAYALFRTPSVNEQCVILCPEGDIEGGIVLAGLFSDTFPAPADGDHLHLKLADDGSVDYDPAGKLLLLTLANSILRIVVKQMKIVGPVKIEGDVEVTGKITATGKIKSDEEVEAAGVKLTTHVHPYPGLPGKTQKPEVLP